MTKKKIHISDELQQQLKTIRNRQGLVGNGSVSWLYRCKALDELEAENRHLMLQVAKLMVDRSALYRLWLLLGVIGISIAYWLHDDAELPQIVAVLFCILFGGLLVLGRAWMVKRRIRRLIREQYKF